MSAPVPPTIVDRALTALAAFGVTTEREAGQLLPMWLHYREMTADDRNAVYQHYRTELGGKACPNCAPGYDCERGIYTPAEPIDPLGTGWTQGDDFHTGGAS